MRKRRVLDKKRDAIMQAATRGRGSSATTCNHSRNQFTSLAEVRQALGVCKVSDTNGGSTEACPPTDSSSDTGSSGTDSSSDTSSDSVMESGRM